MFQVAGKTGNGVLQSVQAAGIYGIGVDVDQWISTHDQADCIVTSAEKHLTKAVREGIEAFAGGSARAGNVFYGADNDGIGTGAVLPVRRQRDHRRDQDGGDGRVRRAWRSGDLDPCQPSGLCYAGKEDTGT